jgi:hypothetical protein
MIMCVPASLYINMTFISNKLFVETFSELPSGLVVSITRLGCVPTALDLESLNPHPTTLTSKFFSLFSN